MEADRLDAVALITGAGSGIGAAVARDIARRSEGGLILVDFDESALTAVADDLEQHKVAPERVSTLAFDVADQDRWRQAADFIRGQYGRLDWAVVNAGVAHSAPIEETDLVDWRRVMSTNLDGAFLTLRTVMPLMRGNLRGGRIVVSASAAAIKAERGVAGYGASKAGLLQLMRVAAKEGAPDNIRVNAIAPGAVVTDKQLRLWYTPEQADEMAGRQAIRRRLLPTDIARTALFLAADDSEMITKQYLVVDGGLR
jgi:2-keto-3-deoxy-L-fuconate dehydrogenase